MLKLLGVVYRVLRDLQEHLEMLQRVRKLTFSLTHWKVRPKKVIALWMKSVGSFEGIPSTSGHVHSARNPGRPLSKAKYSLVTDSELVQ